ncbi:MAG: glycosyltransferase [Bifidobacteriaceae bacterium]|jgi:GT2 family glycosyltransferase|nr:glycosyltransferase [Bifidobacteriaceae bacterium]
MRVTSDVAGVIVTNGKTPYFSDALKSVLKSRKIPERIIVVDVSDDGVNQLNELHIGKDICSLYFIAAPKTRTFQGAVHKALESEHFPNDAKWIWTLHDDVVVDKNALSEQLKAMENQQTVAVVGAKQLKMGENQLINVGWSVMKNGERFSNVRVGEIDQQQHDTTEDVFGVSLTGALIDIEFLRKIGGFDSNYGHYGSAEDFAMRTWLAGKRIRVAASAKIYHAQSSLNGIRATATELLPAANALLEVADVLSGENGTETATTAKSDDDVVAQDDENGETSTHRLSLQRAELGKLNGVLRYRLSNIKSVLFLPMLLYTLVAIPFKVAAQLAKKNTVLAKGELIIPLLTLLRVSSIVKHRKLIKTNTNVPLSTLNALMPDKDQLKEFRDTQKLLNAPLNPESLLSEAEYIAYKKAIRNRRITLFMLILLLLAGTIVIFRDSLLALAGGAVLAGGMQLPSNANFFDLFTAATTHFANQSVGYDIAPNPLLAVMLIPTAIFGFSAQNAVTMMYLLSFLGAGLAMWAAAGVFTRNSAYRFIASFFYAFSLPMLINATNGDLGALITGCVAPLMLFAYTRGIGTIGSFTAMTDIMAVSKVQFSSKPRIGAIAGAGIALSVCLASTPVLVLVLPVLVLLVGIFVRRFRLFLFSLLPSAVLLAMFGYDVITNFFAGGAQLLLKSSGATGNVITYSTGDNAFTYLSAPVNFVPLLSLLLLFGISVFLRVSLTNNALRKVLLVLLTVGLGASSVLFEYTAITTANPPLQARSNTLVPLIGAKMQNDTGKSRVLALYTDDSHDVSYQILRKSTPDFIDTAVTFSLVKPNEKSRAIADLAGKLVTGDTAVESGLTLGTLLAQQGIGGVLLQKTTPDSLSFYSITGTINSIQNLRSVIEGDEMLYWRVDSEVQPVWNSAEFDSAQRNPLRYGYIAALLVIFAGYALLAVPITAKRRALSAELDETADDVYEADVTHAIAEEGHE